jgi:hypothetical protein
MELKILSKFYIPAIKTDTDTTAKVQQLIPHYPTEYRHNEIHCSGKNGK